ncbi:MAG: hypothetical protein BroJett018_45690 [Chloroflexota bacterium]|nr:AAA family ATPase [Chloroflexota bacterium]NOG65388.1 ATP-binding protein [Chloroflexota bacterium]GIK66775.1 MAG: hypothetical protein BroJett018_45690 [Chloroflexota bacterium]
MDITAYDVFTTIGLPHWTYVERPAYESLIEKCIKERTIAFVHGPSKSGKTVIVRKVLEKLKTRYFEMSARNFKSADEFAETLARQLKIPTGSEADPQTKIAKVFAELSH